MTQDDHRRRPPPATGRQDRHRPAPPAPARMLAGDAPVGPRGAEYYVQHRAQPYGLGCLIVVGLAAVASALVMLAIALIPAGDVALDTPGAEPPAAAAPVEAEE